MSDIFITAELGPYQTEHMAAWRAEQDRVRLARIGYDPDLIWYEVKEVYDEDI